MGLLDFVNKKYRIHPRAGTLTDPKDLPGKKIFAIREKLWENGTLIDEYLDQWDIGLPEREAAIIATWKKRLSGKFIILKQLKKQAILLHAEEGGGVYGVQGLYSSLAETVPGNMLPLMVEAVLLPFEGRLIYDGFLLPYPVHFGGGCRRDFNQQYQRAKERGEVITSIA